MLCYRRAIREDPRALDARFHLGEVLWQIGRPAEALNEWSAAAAAHPHVLAPHIARAEASLASGDMQQAHAAAMAALGLAPDLARAKFVAGCALLARSPEDEEAERAAGLLIAALASEPALLAVPSLAGPLAATLERNTAPQRRREIFVALLVQRPPREVLASTPALLLALMVENTTAEPAATIFDAAQARAYGAAEHDGLRRLALAAERRGHPAAAALAERYTTVCVQAFASSVPLVWPHRTAGDALRVLILADAPEIAAKIRERAAREDVSWSIALLGDTAVSGSDTSDLHVVAIGTSPGAPEAHALAALDADLLLDAVGLGAAVGPLLARRPARALLALPSGAPAVAPPLVDGVIANPDELPLALRSGRASLEPTVRDMPDPAAMAALFANAVREHQQGAHDRAREAYDEILRLQPGCGQALFLRGTLARDMADPEAALADFTAALSAAPRYIDARVAAAQVALELGRPELAGRLAQQELADAPGFTAQWRAWGAAELAQGDAAKARKLLEHALELDPNDAESHYNLGVALQSERALGEAARSYQRALAYRPDLVAADFNLGVIFHEQGHVDAAIAAFGQVLRHDPRYAPAYKNLGEVLFAAGRLDAWRANFLQFETHCPQALALAVQALEVCQHFADFERLDRYLDGLRNERFVAGSPTELAESLEELLYLLLFFDVEPDVVYRFAQTYDATARRVYGVPREPRAIRRPGRIRVGYLSADLRNHVMGKMVWEAVRHHDKEHFELSFFSLSTESDEWTDRYRELGDRFEVLALENDRRAAERLSAYDLDVLVDLSTHTRGARPGILAHKPARVQITHVASAGTVGLSAIDFKLTDDYADVPASQAYMIERMLPMRGCVYPYRHVPPAADHGYRRDRLALAPSAVVIGAFVTPLKLSRRCLRLWSEILKRMPRARLAISPLQPAWVASFVRLAASAGIDRSRLVVVPQGRDEAENQARYEVVDFVLDPMPFGGVNGTLEALDMGTPVVTLCGRRHGERTSYSILANLGVLDTVTASGPEYVDCAVRLGTDAEFMVAVRAKIRERLSSSVLTDMPRHTRALEAAYVEALKRVGSTSVDADAT